MLQTIVFDDEITLWWDRVALSQGEVFLLTINGEKCPCTNKTHYSFFGLQECTAYTFTLDIADETGNTVKRLDTVCVTTLKRKKRIDVTKAPYLAVGDGVTVNTACLQRALDDCKQDECVYFPKGTYLTGALDVHGDTEIYLEKDATLQGSCHLQDYMPKRKSRFEGTEMECYASLLNMGELDRKGGYNCRNVVIRGGGAVLGGGKALAENTIAYERERLQEYLQKNADYVKECENANTIPGRARGRLIAMNNCQNILFSRVTLGFGPAWNIHFVYSENIVTHGCKILSQGVWNGDGWDPDSSENCTVFDTEFCTHDDSIAIKSGKNPEGNIVNRPTKNIRIFDCYGKNGIAIGSEMSGGVDGVYIWDCQFGDSYSGVVIKTMRKRGGYIRNVCIHNSTFKSFAILTRLTYNNDGESAPTLPVIENIYAENVTLTGERMLDDGTVQKTESLVIDGLPEKEYYVKNVTLKNLCVKSTDLQTWKIGGVDGLTIENIHFID